MNDSTPTAPSLAMDVYWPMMKSAALITAGELGVFVALNQRAQLRLVKTGQRTGEAVEILAGLSEGETVIVTDVDRLIEGHSVEAK